MSILAFSLPVSPPTPPTTLPAAQAGSPAGIVLMLGVMFTVVLAAWLTGVFRPKALAGPQRVPPGRGAWAMALVMAGGMFLSIALQASYLSYRMQQLRGPTSTQSTDFDISLLTGGDFAIISIVPILAFILLLAGDWSIAPTLPKSLGIAAGRLRSSILPGLVSLVFVGPFMYAVIVVTEQLYELLRFQHPKEHELLRAMGESKSAGVRVALVIGAVVVAPLFEELIFRGHLQSLLRALFARIGLRMRQFSVMARSDDPHAFSGTAALPAEPPLVLGTNDAASSAASWGAIVLTSICFALVHDRWTWPVIFLLALCLGYAYERTQNLWVSIIIHAGFNLTQTIMFLAMYG